MRLNKIRGPNKEENIKQCYYLFLDAIKNEIRKEKLRKEWVENNRTDAFKKR